MDLQETLWKIYSNVQKEKQEAFEQSPKVIQYQQTFKNILDTQQETFKHYARNGITSATLYETSGADCAYLKQATTTFAKSLGFSSGHHYLGIPVNYDETNKDGNTTCSAKISWDCSRHGYVGWDTV